MNRIKYFLYWLTHPILCKLRWHKLILWNNDIEGGDKQCWCCKEDGGGWIKTKKKIQVKGYKRRKLGGVRNE